MFGQKGSKGSTLSALTQRFGGASSKALNNAKRIGKTQAKFQFEVNVHDVSGLKPGGKYFVKWTRGLKVASTKMFRCTASVSQKVGEKLALMCTMFFDDQNNFDEKDAKLSVVRLTLDANGIAEEKTIAKIHFNLSEFCGVPSASADRTFELSDTVKVKCTVSCTFMAGADGTKSGSGALSGSSGMSDTMSLSGMSCAESSVLDSDSIADLDDFADMDDDFADLNDDSDPSALVQSRSQRLREPEPEVAPEPKSGVKDTFKKSISFAQKSTPASSSADKEKSSVVRAKSALWENGSETGSKASQSGLSSSEKVPKKESVASRKPSSTATATSSVRHDSTKSALARTKEYPPSESSAASPRGSGASAVSSASRAQHAGTALSPRPNTSNTGSPVSSDANGVARLREQVERLQQENATLTARNASGSASQGRLNALEKQNLELREQLEQARDAASAGRRRSYGGEVDMELEALRSENTGLKAKLRTLEQQHKVITEERDALRLEHTADTISSMQRIQNDLLRENTKLQHEVDRLSELVETSDSTVAQVEEQLQLERNKSKSSLALVAELEKSKRSVEASRDELLRENSKRNLNGAGSDGGGGLVAGRTVRDTSAAPLTPRERLEKDKTLAKLEASVRQLENENAALQRALRGTKGADAGGSGGAELVVLMRQRDEEIQELKRQVVALQREKSELEMRAVKSKDEESELLRTRLRQARADMDDLEFQKHELQRELDRLHRAAAASSSTLDEHEKEHERQLDDLREDKARVERRFEKQRAELAAERDEAMRNMDELRQRKDAEIVRLQGELDEALYRSRARTADDADSHKKRAERLEEKLERNVRERDELVAQLEGKVVEVKEARREVMELRKELGDVRVSHQLQLEGMQQAEKDGNEDGIIMQLVEAKMRMADFEEENLRYRNIIQKMQNGNKTTEVQRRLAEHAAKLELRLAEAHQKVDLLQEQLAKRKNAGSWSGISSPT
ncbi:hypothetical protein FVE85_6803 [Porphyridium purpureum]|uniref:C2 NT-type domain-containing protein n=1 Tax=Porphyridium purpureum TaxID=35688 RepID=A0A5J4Z7S4_PORPP|nr:hypothetical protein FVE85_6803 [Porphyridium purpureum]|eukprot:POR2433..scf295_1